ncbi:MAG TPA: malonyl-ACP O-methyltransferase BioC [Usitatibacteraceae bacterium]|nr:malonyl-ACP O-methyltransferase BioC [Usitatibacteraceae bacterium]
MSRPALPLKRDVRRSFGARAADYDAHAVLQREIGARLMERLDLVRLQPQRILDLGSGTGFATRAAMERYPDAQVIAVDIAPAMLAAARTRAAAPTLLNRFFARRSKLAYLCADAEALPLAAESFDLVLSNLTLQWCDAERVIAEAQRVIAPEGLVMFTTFGPDTLKELRAAFRAADAASHVNDFVDMHDLGDMLVSAGFSDPVMDQELVTLTYADLRGLFADLKGIGAHNVLPGRPRGLTGKSRWQRMVAAYEALRRDNRLPATYEVVYGHAWKPAGRTRKTVDGVQAVSLGEFRRMLRKAP